MCISILLLLYLSYDMSMICPWYIFHVYLVSPFMSRKSLINWLLMSHHHVFGVWLLSYHCPIHVCRVSPACQIIVSNHDVLAPTLHPGRIPDISTWFMVFNLGFHIMPCTPHFLSCVYTWCTHTFIRWHDLYTGSEQRGLQSLKRLWHGVHDNFRIVWTNQWINMSPWYSTHGSWSGWIEPCARFKLASE